MSDLTISYSQLRANLSAVMSEVVDDKITAHITGKNGENCVLIAEDEYLALKETLYLFTNLANTKHLEESFQQAQSGDFIKVNL